MTDEILGQLPAWAIFCLGVVWLAFQAVTRIVEQKREKERAEVVRRYRESRSPDSDPPPPVTPREATGSYDVRLLLDQDRTTQEILSLARQNDATMRGLAQTLAGQGAVLERMAQTLDRIVTLQEREQETHDALITAQREIAKAVSVLTDHAEIQ